MKSKILYGLVTSIVGNLNNNKDFKRGIYETDAPYCQDQYHPTDYHKYK